MNNDFAVLLSPQGCFTRSSTAYTFQRDAQAYYREVRGSDQLCQRQRLTRATLGVRRLTPEVEQMIRGHLGAFDLRDVWMQLSRDRRFAVCKALYERVHLAPAGRANGTTAFTDLLGEGREVARQGRECLGMTNPLKDTTVSHATAICDNGVRCKPLEQRFVAELLNEL